MSPPRNIERPDSAAAGELPERLFKWLRAAVATLVGRLRGQRLVELITILALLGGGLLIVSDFVTLFQIKLGPTVIDEPTGGDQHSYAAAVIGAVIVGSALLARATESWPPASAAAALALAALAIALLGDRPDATRSDLVRGGRIANASPALGFSLELAGAITALGAAIALAYVLRGRTSFEQRRPSS